MDNGVRVGKTTGIVRCIAHGDVFDRSLTCEQEFRDIHASWMERKEEEEQRAVKETEERQGEVGDTVTAEGPVEAKTPVAFVPQDFPTATIDAEIPPSISQDTESPSAFHDLESLPEPFISVTTGSTSSPTLSISTVSDLTPTELGEGIEHREERMAIPHDTLYFEDGNIEIMCGDVVFRAHSTVVSFSSPKLRDILSRLALLHDQTPGPVRRCPRVTIPSSAEDFAILLKMIYTPG